MGTEETKLTQEDVERMVEEAMDEEENSPALAGRQDDDTNPQE